MSKDSPPNDEPIVTVTLIVNVRPVGPSSATAEMALKFDGRSPLLKELSTSGALTRISETARLFRDALMSELGFADPIMLFSSTPTSTDSRPGRPS